QALSESIVQSSHFAAFDTRRSAAEFCAMPCPPDMAKSCAAHYLCSNNTGIERRRRAMAVETPEVELGWKAADFTLPGVDGKTHSLKDLAGKNGTVVAFICNH